MSRVVVLSDTRAWVCDIESSLASLLTMMAVVVDSVPGRTVVEIGANGEVVDGDDCMPRVV